MSYLEEGADPSHHWYGWVAGWRIGCAISPRLEFDHDPAQWI